MLIPGVYDARYFPKDIFSRATISQVCDFPSGNFPKVRFGLLREPSAATDMKLPLGKQSAWDPFNFNADPGAALEKNGSGFRKLGYEHL